MRRLLFCFLIALPVAANAQFEASTKAAKDVRDQSRSEAAQEEGSEGGAPEGTMEAAGGEKAGGDKGAGTTHTVEKGDTLWDLSQKYLGSPWYWPKVWSYNPEIANPHWIYPGNVVKFVGTGEEVPTQVEVGEGPEGEQPEVEPGTIMEDEDRVSVAGKLGYQTKGGVNIRTPGFVTPEEIEESGVLAESSAETTMLTFPQTAFATFKKSGDVHVGATYLVFRKGKEILHPITGERVGYQTNLIGTVKLLRVDKNFSVVQITATWDEIHRGDLIGPYSENLVRHVNPKPNERANEGYVVAATRGWLTQMGEQETLIVDKGANDGVQPGNTMTILRALDGNSPSATLRPQDREPGFPLEEVGTCMAVEVKSKASICVLIRSWHEIVKGDRFEMRTGRGGPAASP